MQGRGPIRGTLKHSKVSNILGDGLDDLNGRGAGANNANALAPEIYRIMRPAGGMEGLALKRVSPFYIGKCGC
jgi:hypothetical protein